LTALTFSREAKQFNPSIKFGRLKNEARRESASLRANLASGNKLTDLPYIPTS